MTFKGCHDAAFGFVGSVVELAKTMQTRVVEARAEATKDNLEPINGLVSGFTKHKKGVDFKAALIAYVRSNTNIRFDKDTGKFIAPKTMKVSPVGKGLWYSPEKRTKSAVESKDGTPISDAMFYAGLKTWAVTVGKRDLSASQKVELKGMINYLSS